LGNITAIADELAGQALSQLQDRFAIIHVARGHAEGQQFAPVIDDEMELEAIESPHGGFAATGHLLEDPVAVNAAVVAHHQGRRIDEGDPGVLAPAGVKIDAQRHQGGGNQRHETIITQQVGKLASAVPTQVPQVKGFEVAVLGLMEIDQNRHDLAKGQSRGSLPLARAVRQELAMPSREKLPAEIIDVAKEVF